jgi:pyruvate/2-oxoglutarate dehydrogenase complex dihydrolipoamide acyltransferase (E2) component
MSDFIYKVHRENPNDEFVIVASLSKKSGSEIKTNEIVCSLEATKNAYDVEAPQDGYLFFKHNEGDRVEIGDTLFAISSNKDFTFTEIIKTDDSQSGRITRKAQKIIDEFGIDSSVFLNSGARVGEKEVRDYIEKNNLVSKASQSTEILPDVHFIDEEPSPTKAFEIHYLKQSSDVIYSKVSREISLELIEKIQKTYPGTTLGEIVSFGTLSAIKKFPYVNSCYTKNKIRKYSDYNLGVAINIGKGLKVPVIKNFSQLTLSEISKIFKDLAMSYVRDELKGSDLVNGTFTMTDLSSLGVKDFMPVVNKDQGAILGICAPSPFTKSFNIILGFDHRIIDGMYAAQFLKEIEASLRKL